MSRTIPGKKVFKGRGALSNPAGRFERQDVEEVADGWYVEEQPDTIATTVEPDRARTIISRNDSPDIPFEQSINPYRGCEHGCIYCVGGDTPILMADGATRRMAEIRAGDEIYGTVRQGWYRRYVKTRVLAHWSVVKPAYLIILEDGTELIAGADHRFLTERGWKFVTGTEQGRARRPHLTTGNKLMGTGAFVAAPEKDADYRRGYLCGLIRGDGMLGEYSYSGVDGRGLRFQHHFRLALCDFEALERAQNWLQLASIETRRFKFSAASASRRPMEAIRSHAGGNVDRVRELIRWPCTAACSWRAGFLAGIFDAEGSYSDGILRISNTDPEIIGWIGESLRVFGFRFVIEHSHRESRKPIDVVRLLGGLSEHLRFFHRCNPAISRKCDLSGQAVKSEARLGVVSIERLSGAMRLYDITTGTEDFIANGVVSHNCYARPSHAYLGWNAGLDFETRLLVKTDAPELLRRQLAAPRWRPEVIALSGNTDCYQPVERRLKVTRGVLEVLRDFRNPVGV
ncbi:MAG: LAGLIDADG family homing endonuclease, partial [Steroidobacteraceae bacterium]